MIIQRDMMRELRSHGFEVLPKNAITGNRREMEMTIKDNLSNSRLSLHLIGEDYGDSIEGHNCLWLIYKMRSPMNTQKI